MGKGGAWAAPAARPGFWWRGGAMICDGVLTGIFGWRSAVDDFSAVGVEDLAGDVGGVFGGEEEE